MDGYNGPERRRDNCTAHEQNTRDIAAIKTNQAAASASSKTWRLVGSIAGGCGLLLASFLAWVASDNLTTLRNDIKDLKTELKDSTKIDSRSTTELKYMGEKLNALEVSIKSLEQKVDDRHRRY